MDNSKNISEFDRYLQKGTIRIYYIYAIFSCLGYLVDIFNFWGASKIIPFNNSATISITVISFVLYHFRIISLRVSFGILLYAAFANVTIDTFLNLSAPLRLHFFLRDSLFIVFLITLGGFLVRKIHAIILTGLYVGMAIALNIAIHSDFLSSSIHLIILFVSVYALVIHYFVSVLEKSIIEREKTNKLILQKNEIVNNTNTILEERQQQIEEQSEVLGWQKEKLEEQSQQLTSKNNELEELNKTKDKFFSIIAHDLKNPFHAILGFSEILETNFHKLTDEKKIKYINLLSSTSKKTYNLLENLLQWARTQSNNIEFKPARVSINALLKQNLLLFLETYRRKKITVEEEIRSNCFAYADENMISTVLRNLLSNAIKFTPDEGKIFVRCKIENNFIIVEIEDTGIGMDQEIIVNLFRIDKNLSQLGTSGEKGTGLGLIICKDFIEKNGGKIWVTSEKDKGSLFAFTIPQAID